AGEAVRPRDAALARRVGRLRLPPLARAGRRYLGAPLGPRAAHALAPALLDGSRSLVGAARQRVSSARTGGRIAGGARRATSRYRTVRVERRARQLRCDPRWSRRRRDAAAAGVVRLRRC